MTQVYYLSIYIILPTCVYIIEPAGPPAAPVYFFFFFELNIFFCNIYQDFFVYSLHHIQITMYRRQQRRLRVSLQFGVIYVHKISQSGSPQHTESCVHGRGQPANSERSIVIGTSLDRNLFFQIGYCKRHRIDESNLQTISFVFLFDFVSYSIVMTLSVD